MSDYVPVYVCVCCRLVPGCPREVALRGLFDQFEVRDLLHLSFSSSSHHGHFFEAPLFGPCVFHCLRPTDGVVRAYLLPRAPLVCLPPVLNHLYSSCQTLPFELVLYYLHAGRSGAGIADSVLIQGQLM